MTFCFFGSMFEDKPITLLLLYIYICPQPFILSHLKYILTKNDSIYLQLFNKNPNSHMILTRMSWLWPMKRACAYYWVATAYGFDVEVRRCGFCKSCDWLWVIGCLVWRNHKCIFFFLELRKNRKELSNWLLMRLVYYYYVRDRAPGPFLWCWAKPTWMGGVVLLPLKMEIRLVILSPLN